MTPFASLLQHQGLGSLVGFDAEEAVAARMQPSKVRDWAMVHAAYYGAIRGKDADGRPLKELQALAAELAIEGGFSLDQLVRLEKLLCDVDDPAERMTYRMELLSTPMRFEAFARRAKATIPAKQRVPKPRAAFSKSRCRMRSFGLISDEHRMADLEHTLRDGIDTTKPAGPQMEAKFWSLFGLTPDSHGGTGTGSDSGSGSGSDSGDAGPGAPSGPPTSPAPPAQPAPPAPAAPTAPATPVAPAATGKLATPVRHTQILVPLPDYLDIVGGDGDECILGASDGTTMTGAEFLAQNYGEVLGVALFHPLRGPVNAYRTERYANPKQRLLAKLANPVCAVPGCRQPADQCEVHHIKAWSRGGESNQDNLVTLCQYHNQVNDDDPERRSRGRPEWVGGRAVWISPRGYPAVNQYHLFGAMHALFGDLPRSAYPRSTNPRGTYPRSTNPRRE